MKLFCMQLYYLISIFIKNTYLCTILSINTDLWKNWIVFIKRLFVQVHLKNEHNVLQCFDKLEYKKGNILLTCTNIQTLLNVLFRIMSKILNSIYAWSFTIHVSDDFFIHFFCAFYSLPPSRLFVFQINKVWINNIKFMCGALDLLICYAHFWENWN